jgi:hypothetical protein
MSRTATILGALALAACSKSESMPPADGGGGAGGGGGTTGATGMTCQQIRICVLEGPCADDSCVQDCEQRGTADAQTAFEALRTCTMKTCPTLSDPNYVNCTCGEQCQAGGSCLHEADVCLGTVQIDDVCDSLCA